MTGNARDHDLDRYIDFLPQRPPFRFVDRVLAHEPGVRAVAERTFPAGDRVFENHLPGNPLVPGVILIEALAQTSGLVCIPEEGRPATGYLAEVRAVRFHRLIHPDETIRLTATLARAFGSVARFEVEAEVDGERAAAGELVLGGMRWDE